MTDSLKERYGFGDKDFPEEDLKEKYSIRDILYAGFKAYWSTPSDINKKDFFPKVIAELKKGKK